MNFLPISSRVRCPCCGYPTLSEAVSYEICELCNWEDDGQGEADADEVRGGPNADYSLSEARRNFGRFRVMYAPGRDQRFTGDDSALTHGTKGRLMEAFEKLEQAAPQEAAAIESEIVRLEQVLVDELRRGLREAEARLRDGAA